MQPYRDSTEHLRDEMARLDLLLRRALTILRQADAPVSDEFRGLVISEPEIEEMVRGKDFFGERWRREESCRAQLSPLDQGLDKLRANIDARRELSRRDGIHLALPHLAHCFNLSPAEVDILLIALAPELESSYETLYAYLQNDVTRKRPSVNLALSLICRSESERFMARRIFHPAAPLLHHRLIELGEEQHDRQPALLRKTLKLDEAIVGFLLDQMPVELNGASLITPEINAGTLDLDPATRSKIEKLAAMLRESGSDGRVIRLSGKSDCALREAAEVFCLALDRRLLIVELGRLDADEARIAAWLRDAALWRAVPAVIADEPSEHEAENQRIRETEARLWRALREVREPVLLLGPDAAFPRVPPEVRLWCVEIAAPDFTLRRRAWEAALNGYAVSLAQPGEEDADRLADTFRFGGDRIAQTRELAACLAALRDSPGAEPTPQDLLEAGRALTTPQIGRCAIRIEPRYSWPDIVLPNEKLQQLRRIAAWMKHRRLVHREWGYGRKLARGKGLNVLFTGPSGTGKTMAAEVLAGELALDLYQIDLSNVVSKYIGETEKNLSAIFNAAEQSQALLFFDEADALFGKRTEVKDAHDRYANIEVNYLLQRVEQYEGVVILATNLQRNLDEAFIRRMQEVVEFPFPDEDLRERIWRRHFPDEAPRAGDIDFTFLARQFKLAGGHIKNIALSAAFLAAESREPISMLHIILATKAEHRKQGKLCVKSDFGPYYEMIR
jgi:hypothetical protein